MKNQVLAAKFCHHIEVVAPSPSSCMNVPTDWRRYKQATYLNDQSHIPLDYNSKRRVKADRPATARPTATAVTAVTSQQKLGHLPLSARKTRGGSPLYDRLWFKLQSQNADAEEHVGCRTGNHRRYQHFTKW